MKRKLLFLICAIVSLTNLNAQTVVTGDITANTTWTNNIIYHLEGGFVYVTNNATLTIEPGTIITGDASTLVITRGAKLMAEGTATQPIVFTSFQTPGNRGLGDWGGIIICGKAPINDPAGERPAEGGIDAVKGLYGGTDVNDNSGIVKYVRIEYAGIAYIPNSETNGLTCGGVGLGTTIDYVQVSHGGDDAFEFFGGTVNAKHLIVNKTLDDMFDTDYGFVGRIQFAVGLSDSLVADVSGSNGFESDNDANGTTNGPLTKPIFSNVSIFGPKMSATTAINGNYKRGAHFRRSTSTCAYNSLISGFPTGFKIESDNSANNAKNGSLQFKNNIIAGYTDALDSAGITISWGTVGSMLNWFNSNGNSLLPNSTDLMAVDAYNYADPNFLLQAASPAMAGASFASPNLTDAFFTPTTYRGAFDGTNDWTSCWSNFDPQNADYSTPGINYLPISATFVASNNTVTFTNTSLNTNTYSWDFGDGSALSTTYSPVHTFTTFGDHVVTVTASNGDCTDTMSFNVFTVNGINEIAALNNTTIYPNPASTSANLKLNLNEASTVSVELFDIAGKLIATSFNGSLNAGTSTIEINTLTVPNGLYYVKISSANAVSTMKLQIAK